MSTHDKTTVRTRKPRTEKTEKTEESGGEQYDDALIQKPKTEEITPVGEPVEVEIKLDNSTLDEKEKKKEEEEKAKVPIGKVTMNKKEKLMREHRAKLDLIRKKAGLLDDPSNYLRIGVDAYYGKKREENLYNYRAKMAEKGAHNEDIRKAIQKEYTTTYDAIKPLGIPVDRIDKIALKWMELKKNEESEIIDIKYPFLNLN